MSSFHCGLRAAAIAISGTSSALPKPRATHQAAFIRAYSIASLYISRSKPNIAASAIAMNFSAQRRVCGVFR